MAITNMDLRNTDCISPRTLIEGEEMETESLKIKILNNLQC